MSIDDTPPPTLLAFAPMIDTECARLVLRYHGVAYREQDRLFGWVSFLTLLRGGWGRIPFLYGSGLRLSGSHAIADRFDARATDRPPLVPADAAAKAQVEDDFGAYNTRLAREVAVFAYFHLLPERALMIPCFGKPITGFGRTMLPYTYGLFCGMFRIMLGLKPARAAQASQRIAEQLDLIDVRIADGRRFLTGDTLTLGDLALAAALAPMTLPPAYAAQLPALAALPAAMQALVVQTRKRPAAALVLRIYGALEAGIRG